MPFDILGFIKQRFNRIAFLFFFLLFLVAAFKRFDNYVEGDGFEYVLMTESFFRHQSFELRYDDTRSFLEAWSSDEWKNLPKRAFFHTEYLPHERYTTNIPYLNFGGYFNSLKSKLYCYHFWGYSLFVVPFRVLTHFLGINILWSFTLAHVALIGGFLYVLWFISSWRNWFKFVFATVVLFPSAYWYVSWEHSEIFLIALVASGLIFFVENWFFVSMFLFSIAAWQNQTLILLPFALAVWSWITKKQTFVNLVLAGGIVLTGLLPSFFYYYHFKQISLITYAHYLDEGMVTAQRYLGFFYDLNQGMILASPLIMILLPFAIIKMIYDSIKGKMLNLSLVLLLALMAMVYVACQMRNWSPGEAVVNRYVTWTLPIIAFVVLIEIEYWAAKAKYLFLYACAGLIVLMQYTTSKIHKRYDKFDWSGTEMMPVAKFVLNKFPQLYNPDPVIFSCRTVKDYSINYPVLSYFDQKILKKLLILKDSIDLLRDLNFSNQEIEKIKQQNDNFGWIYVPNELLVNKSDKLYEKLRQQKIVARINQITKNREWFEEIKRKASIQNIPVDSVLKADAIFIVDQELNAQN